MIYIIPVVLLLTVVFATIKKSSVYDGFIEGAKEAVNLVLSVLPYLIGIFIMCEVFFQSGLSGRVCDLLEKPFSMIGIPREVIELVLIRPLSGSGSLVLTEKIFSEHGVDGYAARCASVISGCSDTVFYIVAVYLSKSKDKKSHGAILIALFSNFIGGVFACFLCKIL